MPKIIVVSELGEEQTAIALEERVVPAHLEDDHSAAQLVERLGWAILDAEQAEGARRRPRRALPRHYAPQVTEWTRDAAGKFAA
jgi:hypothetical protein